MLAGQRVAIDLFRKARGAGPCVLKRGLGLPTPSTVGHLRRLSAAHFTEYSLSSDDKLEIIDLCHKFDLTLNVGQQERLGKFFVDEAEVITPICRVKGVQPILEYFDRCRPIAKGNRHLTCNIMIEPDGVNAAKVTAYRILHAANSPPTLLATGIIEDKLLNVNGEWKFLQRNFIMDPPSTPAAAAAAGPAQQQQQRQQQQASAS